MRPRPTSRRITVSNDDAGIVSFRVNVPNRPTLGQDMLFEVWVDTDNNAATGAAGARWRRLRHAAGARGDQPLQVGRNRLHAPLRRSVGSHDELLVPGRPDRPHLGGRARQHEGVQVLRRRDLRARRGSGHRRPGRSELESGRRPRWRCRPLPVHRERRQANARRARYHDHALQPRRPARSSRCA